MQPPPTRPPAPGWLRQLGSALTAVALIAAVLTPIALSASPADAHPQRVQRCSYDPFAGQQCWYENVAHTHTPPPSSTPPGQGHPGGTDNEQQDNQDEQQDDQDDQQGQGHPGGTDNEQQDDRQDDQGDQQGQGHPGGTDEEQQDRPQQHQTQPGQGHPGGTDNEQQDRPQQDQTQPGQGHPGGTDNEQQDRPQQDQTQPGQGHPGGTDNEQQGLPPDTTSQPDTEDEGPDGDEGRSDDDPDSDEAGNGEEAANGGGTNSGTGDDSTQDPCDAWADSTRDTLFNLNPDGTTDITPAPEGCGTSTQEVIDALGDFFKKMGERRIENAEAKRQAYEELREAIRDAWNYEIPVLSEINEQLDTALNVANCAGLGYVYVRSKGKAAKMPGFTQVVSALGCTTYISSLAIDDSDPDPDDGDHDENGQGSGNAETTEQTVRPVQTPDTTTQSEPADTESDNPQGGSDTGDANNEIESPPTTTTPPAAVGPVTGLGGSADGNVVWLGWNAPAVGPAPTAYRVLRTASAGAEQEVARVGGNAYRDRNVQSGVTYTYRVQAISGTLSGPISAPVSVTIR